MNPTGSMPLPEPVLAQLIDSAPDGMVVVDKEGLIVLVNTEAERLFGYDREELLGRAVEKLVPSSLRGPHHEHRGSYAADPHTRPMGAGIDLLAQRKDGSEFPVEISLSPLRVGHDVLVTAAVRDVSRRREDEAKLRYLAEHDVLTGLLNWRSLLVRLKGLLADDSAQGALLILDIDNFKEVNDGLGHSAGDETIAQVAEVLVKSLRREDLVARIGGDEFAILLPGADRVGARVVAEKLLQVLRRHIFVVSGTSLRLTASAGAAAFRHGDDPEELMATADFAMYKAKSQGRDCFTLADEPDLDRAKGIQVLSWTDRLQRALEHDQLLLHYQPILDLRTNAVTQHEALVRMRGDEGELVPPGAFLPAAERSGLIRDLDLWVVERAISVIAEAKDAGKGEPTIQVNLSARSTADTSLAALIVERIDAAGIDPSKIIFEITETAAIANMERASEFARALAERGCGFALDDFGAGFASFHYLRSLPLTYIKIDGDFVADLAVSEVNQALVSGLKGVADGLGLKLIAECVEQQETLDILRRYGVDYAQGYLIARPSEELPAVSTDVGP